MIKKNGKQISPCIISQIRFNLKLKKTPAKNNKTCSDSYWNEVTHILVDLHKIKDKILIASVLKNKTGMPKTE